MKTVTCNLLGGSCDHKITGETFEEVVEQSKAHGMEMVAKGDQGHIDAMEKAKEGMKDPVAMRSWIDEKKTEFEALPEDE